MLTIIKVLKFILLVFSLPNYFNKNKVNAANIENKGNELNEENFLLTDIGINQHKIPYLIYDQCMLRQEQIKIGSYSLEFFLKTLYICQPGGLLICYPSQLRGENSKNGTIISIPFRLINITNNVTELCENKRLTFCNNPKNNKTCSPGNVGHSIWHGIFINTEIIEGIVFVNIYLSITDEIYKFESNNSFKLEFGKKDNLFTRLVFDGNEAKEIQKKEENLLKEFLSNINKGAYLYQYSGLWALGLDLLPIRAQRFINLFVYRGCTCALQARFTTPLSTEKSFESIQFNSTQEKHCKKRQSNNTYNLGKIKQRFIIFALMPDKNAKYGKLEIKIDNFLINIYINNYSINFEVKNCKGSWIKHSTQGKFVIGETIFFKYGDNIYFNIILQQYYFWITTANNKHFLSLNTFWPNDWLNGTRFNENTKGTLSISGDFVPITMISVGHLVGRNILHKPSNHSYPIPVKYMPYVHILKNAEIQNGTRITLRGFIFKNSAINKMEIALLHEIMEINNKLGALVLLIKINFTEHTILMKSNYGNITINQILLNENYLFDCIIDIFDISNENNTIYNYTIKFNGKVLGSYIAFNEIPISTITHILINGSIGLYILPNIVNNNKIKTKINRYKLKQLQNEGNILCLVGYVTHSKNISDKKEFEINLLNDANEFSEKIGNTVLQLKFIFDPEIYNRQLNLTKELKHLLIMNSYIHNEGKWGNKEIYLNPIGLTGVDFFIRINVSENYFNIYINNAAAKLLYKHRLPSWATEWVMIKGDIEQIKFGEEYEKCKQFNYFKYPLNIINIPENNYLKDGSLIFIEGIIIDENISISFLHQALEWHEFIGQTIFQFNITKENSFLGSYANKQWFPPNCDIKLDNKTTDNKCWHKHELKLNKGEQFKLNILVRTTKYTWRYKISGNWYNYEHQMPTQDVQYINVRGLKQNPKFNYIIKLDKLY